jgi:hypothetical protein
VSAAAALVDAVPPLAMGRAALPARKVCKGEAKLLRTNAMSERKTLSTLAGDMPVFVPIPSQVVLLAAVALQSKSTRHAASFFGRFALKLAVDRVSAARDRVRSVKAELSSPAVEVSVHPVPVLRAGLHPSGSQQDRGQSGQRHSQGHSCSGEEARSETGACGPEGALFDSRSAPALVVVNFLSTALADGLRWSRSSCSVFGCSASSGSPRGAPLPSRAARQPPCD